MKLPLSFFILIALGASSIAQTENTQSFQPYFTAIIVSDINTSIDWYSKNLGLVVLNKMENEERGFKQANLKGEGAILELIELKGTMSPKEAMEGKPKARIEGLFKVGYSVADFDKTVEQFKLSKVDFHGDVVQDPNTGQRMVILKDPDGNRIQIFERENNSKAAEAIILENIDNFSKALMAANYDAVVDAYTSDAKIFPGGRDILHGSEAIRNYWTPPADRKSKLIFHKVHPKEIKIIGKEAYDWGYYEGKTQMEDGSISSWKGKYIITWKEVEAGVWKIYLDIWNRVPNDK